MKFKLVEIPAGVGGKTISKYEPLAGAVVKAFQLNKAVRVQMDGSIHAARHVIMRALYRANGHDCSPIRLHIRSLNDTTWVIWAAPVSGERAATLSGGGALAESDQ